MTLRPILDRIGWEPEDMARRLGCSDEHARNMVAGRTPIPSVVLAWLVRTAVFIERHPPPLGWRNPGIGHPRR